MKKIIKYITADILRNRIVLVYTIVLLIISFSVFMLQDDATKGLLSLLNITLLIVPLISIIFSAIYVYNSAEFIELLVSHPLQRKTIWLSFFYWRRYSDYYLSTHNNRVYYVGNRHCAVCNFCCHCFACCGFNTR